MQNRQFDLTVAATSIAFLLVQLDVSIINVALATIGTRLQTGVFGLQWVVDAYAVTFAALLLSAGGLGDRIGARRMFMLGLVVFTAASALCGLAPGAGSLIAARALQGCGAAALVPGSLALLNLASNADPACRAWGVGLWTAAGSVGLAVGPLLGGVLIALLGWRSIFLVNLPIGLAGLWLTGRFVAPAPGSERPVDWGGQVVAIAALLAGLGSGTPYPGHAAGPAAAGGDRHHRAGDDRVVAGQRAGGPCRPGIGRPERRAAGGRRHWRGGVRRIRHPRGLSLGNRRAGCRRHCRRLPDRRRRDGVGSAALRHPEPRRVIPHDGL
ncbi:MAG: MFS transporter [Rhodopila sp.]